MDTLDSLFSEELAPMPVDKYKLNMIVFVNSAEHYYSELPLDSNLAMFGNNNNGKTSSLAATKILLYPEVNFKSCEKKFAFTSKTGAYNEQESFRHYFPSQLSYLIMEAENPEGKFTMICYSGSQQHREYHRIFLPVEYAQIRHFFFNEEADEQEEDISINTIEKLISEFGGVQTSDPKEIRDYLFNYGGGRNAQYCLVPLISTQNDSISIFKSIYQLAFDNSSTNVLTKAVASIAESGLSKEDAKLEVDFYKLEEQYRSLKNEKDELARLHEFKPDCEELFSNYKKLDEDLDDISLKHAVYTSKLSQQKQQLNEEVSQDYNALNALYLQVSEKSKESANLRNQENKVKADAEALKNRRAKLTERINMVDALIENSGKDIKSLQVQTERELDSKKAMLNAISDRYQTELQRRKVSENLKEKESLLEQKIKTKENAHNRTLRFLDERTASIWNSIHPAFGSALGEPNNEQAEAFKVIADMFDVSNGYLTFLGDSFDSTRYVEVDEDLDLKIECDIDDLHIDINMIKKELSQLDSLLMDKYQDSESRPTTESLNKAINKLSEQRNNLNSYDANKSDVEQYNQQIEQLTAEGVRLHGLAIQAEEVARSIGIEHKQLNDKYNLSNKKLSEISLMLSKLSEMKMLIALKDYPTDSEQFVELAESCEFLELSDIDKLNNVARTYPNRYTEFKYQVKRLESHFTLNNIDAHEARNGLSDYADTINAFKDLFTGLDSRSKYLEGKIADHNTDLSNSIIDIDRAINNVDYRINDINRNLNEYKISNLEAVQLTYKLKPDYEHLRNLARKTAISGSTLNDPLIYESLIKFVSKNTDSKSRRLILSNVIESVSYQYTDADGNKSTTDQSGGTSATVTAAIMSLFMSYICMEGSKLVLPIIVDEITALDAENIDTIVRQIESMDMTVFCATPNETGKVCSAITRWVNISDYISDVYRVEGCVLKVTANNVNSIEDEVSTEQDYKLDARYTQGV